jgi:hypothetical protein
MTQRHAESSQKFDYFVTGIAIALVGWLGGRTDAIVFSSWADRVYLAALAFLLGAAFSGLKRLEVSNTALRLNTLALIGEETASARETAVQTPGTLVDAQTGEELDRQVVAESATEQAELAKQARSLMEQSATRSSRWYTARSWLLVTGLALFVIGRILEGI